MNLYFWSVILVFMDTTSTAVATFTRVCHVVTQARASFLYVVGIKENSGRRHTTNKLL